MARKKTQTNKEEQPKQTKRRDPDYPGYNGDGMFLLSKDEYKKYRDAIPVKDFTWWLRTKCDIDLNHVMVVNPDGSIDENGRLPSDTTCCVRPVFDLRKISREKLENELHYDITIIVPEILAISNDAFRDMMFDPSTTKYAQSQVRAFCKGMEAVADKLKAPESDYPEPPKRKHRGDDER